MLANCAVRTSGGKGNLGMFIERDPNVFAAGVPSAQANEQTGDALQHYLLKDSVDALIGDAIIPPPKPHSLPPLHKPFQIDKRNAGLFGDVAALVNPPSKPKFQSLVEDLKDTAYQSYWMKPQGSRRDHVPMLPAGFDVVGTTFGKPTPHTESLYDVIMPEVPIPDKTPHSKEAGVRVNRKYCSPAFRPDMNCGGRSNINRQGIYMKCCLTDERMINGTANRSIVNTTQANFVDAHQSRLSTCLAPNNNINDLPKGYSFGVVNQTDDLECLTFCEMNKGLHFFRECLRHLNTLRRYLSKRFSTGFYHTFYLNLKYYDKEKTEWVPKDIVYGYCGTKQIRFDPALIEPLLEMWQAFDGSKIKYKTFVQVLNYKEPCPEMPKIPDLRADCLDYRTTYEEMVKPGQPVDNRGRAGVPSGRYIDLDYPITPDGYVKAHRICLPQESDMRSCMNPSVFTSLFVTHRDLYAKREPHVVRRVFEAAGEKFTDKRFNALWEEAKQHHSQGWVCFETFRRTLEKHPDVNEYEEEEKVEE